MGNRKAEISEIRNSCSHSCRLLGSNSNGETGAKSAVLGNHCGLSKEKPAVPVIVNTSFNVRGEPIVCSPEDSYRCFMRTEMDYLVLETLVLDKKAQPQSMDQGDWRAESRLD